MAGKSIYPSIPAPGKDPASMRATLDALRQSMTMITMNAQNPNSNFAPSSAAQVFVTKDELKATGIVGAQGPAGPQGPPGPGVAEAPNDTNTYGRHALTWQIVVAEAPNDANTYGRHATAWQTVLAGANAVFATILAQCRQRRRRCDCGGGGGRNIQERFYTHGESRMIRINDVHATKLIAQASVIEFVPRLHHSIADYSAEDQLKGGVLFTNYRVGSVAIHMAGFVGTGCRSRCCIWRSISVPAVERGQAVWHGAGTQRRGA